MATRGSFQPVTGVQRYAENITRELFAIRDGIRLLAPPGPLRALDGIDIQQIGTSRGHVWKQVESNLPFGRWGETFSDDVVAAAMIDRFVHRAEVLTLTGDSYRTRARRELLVKGRAGTS
jgi:hypothetical protein